MSTSIKKFSLFIIISFLFVSTFYIFTPEAFADISKAECSLNVDVNNTTGEVTISGRVSETNPGMDDSYTHIRLYDNIRAGSVDKTGTESVTGSYKAVFPNGTDYMAYVQGESASNPGGGSSSCYEQKRFSVNRPQPCSINSFTADSTRLPNINNGTTLRSSLSGVFPWKISLLGGSFLPAPSSGNSSGGSSSTGSLPETHVYRLECGNASRDVIVEVSPPVAPCANGATNPPACTVFPPCQNGATNPPACNNFPQVPTNGACATTHYNCSSGSSVNHRSNSSEWTWTCQGLNGGSDASCRESKNVQQPCGNGATNPPACNTFDPCNNGATNPPACNVFPPPSSCSNGATNPPACNVFPPPSPCNNGANNPPACNTFNPCNNGAINPPTCNNFGPNGGWSEWSACSETICGRTGTQTRTCLVGNNCVGPSSQACNAPACPTGAISATSCTIPGGASTCTSFVTWSAQNLTNGATEVTRNNPRNTSVSTNTSGANVSSIINYNASTFFLYHNLYGVPTSLARANVNASCASNTIWDGSKCKPCEGCLTGTLSPASPTCSIPNGSNSCAINFSWETKNPQEESVSAVTRNPNNTTVGTGHIGANVPFVVKHGVETFYLYNSKSTRELAESTVAGVCAPGTGWDIGSNKCKTSESSNCGNGVIDSGEQCDDGNQYNGQCPSNCSIACTIRSCVAPGDIDMNVKPNIIVAGGSSTLTWIWDGGGQCVGTNFDTGGANSGSIQVNPTSTTTYMIRCGTETTQVTLTVKKKPKFLEN